MNDKEKEWKITANFTSDFPEWYIEPSGLIGDEVDWMIPFFFLYLNF